MILKPGYVPHNDRKQNMKNPSTPLALVLAATLTLPCLAAIGAGQSINLKKYSGTWYEIAAYPSYFDKHCTCTRSVYSVQKKGHLHLTNYCYHSGKKRRIEIDNSWLAPIPGSIRSKFKVTFLWEYQKGKYRKLTGNYWILYVNRRYNRAIVGTPDHQFLFFLARRPYLSKGNYNKFINIAKNKGYTVSRLKKVYRGCRFNQ